MADAFGLMPDSFGDSAESSLPTIYGKRTISKSKTYTFSLGSNFEDCSAILFSVIAPENASYSLYYTGTYIVPGVGIDVELIVSVPSHVTTATTRAFAIFGTIEMSSTCTISLQAAMTTTMYWGAIGLQS